MIKNKTVAVVVPTYNEETQIGQVIENMPIFVDRVILVNDSSTDKTLDKMISYLDSKYNSSDLILDNNLDIDIPKNTYNYAERILQKKNREEESFYSHREILNENQKKERIIG